MPRIGTIFGVLLVVAGGFMGGLFIRSSPLLWAVGLMLAMAGGFLTGYNSRGMEDRE